MISFDYKDLHNSTAFSFLVLFFNQVSDIAAFWGFGPRPRLE